MGGYRITNEQADAILAPLNGVRIGDVFFKPYGKQGRIRSYVLVRWPCGHEVEVAWTHLQQGRTTGCGVSTCLQPKHRVATTARRERDRLASFAKAKTGAESEGYTNFTLLDLRPQRNASRPGGAMMISWISYTCPEGHDHEMLLNNWQKGQRCPGCAITGYKTSKPATLYLCHRDVNGGIQRMYGITNRPDGRLAVHRRRGWKLIDRIDGGGQYIANAERAIKKYMKAVGLHGSIHTGGMTGETEAWAYDDLPIDSIRRLMNTVMEARVA